MPEIHHGTASVSESDDGFARGQRPLAYARGSVRYYSQPARALRVECSIAH